MNMTTLWIISGVAVVGYIVLCIAEKALIKKRIKAREVAANDGNTSN